MSPATRHNIPDEILASRKVIIPFVYQTQWQLFEVLGGSSFHQPQNSAQQTAKQLLTQDMHQYQPGLIEAEGLFVVSMHFDCAAIAIKEEGFEKGKPQTRAVR